MSENNNSQIGTMSVRGEDLPVFAYMFASNWASYPLGSAR